MRFSRSSTLVALATVGSLFLGVLPAHAEGGSATAADNVAPSVAFTFPLPGRIISGTVTATADITDDVGVARGELWSGSTLLGVSTQAPFAVSFDTTAFDDGPLWLRWRGVDTSGNTRVFSRQVLVDNTPPQAAFSTPRPGAVVSGTVTASVTASDTVGIRAAHLYSGSTRLATVTSEPYEATVDTTQLGDGSQVLRWRVIDQAGFVRVVSRQIVVDNSAPSLQVTTPDLGPSQVARRWLRIEGTAEDAAELRRVELRVNGQLVRTTSAANFTFVIDTRAFPDGTLDLAVTAVNAVGNTTTQGLVVPVHNTAPDAAVAWPNPGRSVSGMVHVIPSISSSIGIATTTLLINGVQHSSVAGIPDRISFHTQNYTGRVELELVTTDLAGNTAFAPIRVVFVDRQNPTVSFVDPAGSTLSGVASLAVNASDDSGIASVSFAVDGTPVGTVTAAPYVVSWDTTSVASGPVTVTATATDVVGKTTTVSQSFTVSNLSVTYEESMFSMSQTSQTFSPTVTGESGSVSYSLSGTLPVGVTFDEATGVFAGPDAWNFEAVQLSLGDHSCALLTDGTVRCWGANGSGQLGDGTSTGSSSTPVTVVVAAGGPALSGVTQISAGQLHTCAVLTDGTARCWGNNTNGRLGDGTTTNRSYPVQVLASGTTQGVNLLSQVTEISAFVGHTCATLTDSTARCWGLNSFGQLGDGTTTSHNNPVQVLTSGSTQGVNLLSQVTQISAGQLHTCAVLTDGTARCWGNNGTGRLGDGTTNNNSNPVQVLAEGSTQGVSLLTNVAQISAGGVHTCATLTDGTARCWGNNASRQLGDGTITSRMNPVQVLAEGWTQGVNLLANVAQISAGSNYTCVTLTDGTARCWGNNGTGRLGDGTNNNQSNPVQVLEEGETQGTNLLSQVAQVSAGMGHTCALLVDGAVRCWGGNSGGRLGDGTTTNRNNPVAVSGIAGNPGWPSSVTVTATDGVSSVTATITLTKS
jgi:alpha-tubulin suppressor-like RCC1 family protein